MSIARMEMKAAKKARMAVIRPARMKTRTWMTSMDDADDADDDDLDDGCCPKKRKKKSCCPSTPCCPKKRRRKPCCPKPACPPPSPCCPKPKPRCRKPKPCCPKPCCPKPRKRCPKPCCPKPCCPKRKKRCCAKPRPCCRKPRPRCTKRVKCQKPGPITNNGYLNFLRAYRRKHCGLKPKELVMKAARAWCRLPECKKDYYRRQACRVTKSCRHKRRRVCTGK
ncbi:keratin-associated protein 10-11-like isoform X2 [Drosophila navojoa]|uniref:keratin-associated protein 10-11-like isoform X2 n=1 Tax=Drosophila navojoa TaxID=7232 RepID=UPI0011BFA9E4|nr:keratin-associated protein 10-11-like isoform X2 [Drosophila navojoa]